MLIIKLIKIYLPKITSINYKFFQFPFVSSFIIVYNRFIKINLEKLKSLKKERSVILNKQHKLLHICMFSSLTLLTMASINKLLFITSTIKSTHHQKAKIYEWRFGKIHYTKCGKGTPLLLIHDVIPGSSDYEWQEIIKPLSKTHTVYTLDLLGFGHSEKPAITYTNYLYVQLITDFIKNIVGRRCDIITSGSSASIAIMACRLDESLFNRIMLISPDTLIHTGKVPTKRTKTLKFALELPLIGTFLYNIMVNYCKIKTDFKKYYFSNPYHVTPKLIKAYREASQLYGSNSRYVYSSLKGNYINFSVSRALSEINNSIYIINGSDTADYKQIAKEYQKQNASIETNVVYHTKHFPQLENPTELLKHCFIFLG